MTRCFDTYGEVGVELEGVVIVGDVCGDLPFIASRMLWLKRCSFSLNERSFLLLVVLLARYPKLSLYDLFLLERNIFGLKVHE